jgi:hypothetical protein
MSFCYIDNKTPSIGKSLAKDILLHIYLQLVLAKKIEDCTNMLQVFGQDFVCKSSYHPSKSQQISMVRMEKVINDMLKSSRDVHEVERHDQPFIETKPIVEGSLPYINQLHADLVITKT